MTEFKRYTVNEKGFGGNLKIEVAIDPNTETIQDITIVDHHETQGVGTKAIEALPEQFIGKSDSDVDGVSGATISSDAIKHGVQKALNQFHGIEQDQATDLRDGSYQTQVKSFKEINGLPTDGAYLKLSAEIKDNAIKAIDIIDYTDSEVIGGMAYDILKEQVLDSQSLSLDTVSSATVSSNAFLRAMEDVIEQAGGSIEAFKEREVKHPQAKETEYQADIVIIGAGMAGLCAAIEAQDLGANVILLEKHQVLSSSTTRSVGYVVGANTQEQAKAGIEDTTSDLYDSIYSLYKDEKELDPDLLRKMCDESQELNEFLLENGVEFEGVTNVSDKGVRAKKRTHMTKNGGTGLSLSLLESAKDKGVTILMGTEVTELIMDGDTVVGVKAKNINQDKITIQSKAVINCAGSYSNNLDLFFKLNPRADNAEYICGSGDGDGYYLTKQANGDIVDIPYPQMMYYSYSPSWPYCPSGLPASPDFNVPECLLVDGGGRRVTSEDDFCFEYVKKVWEGGYKEGYAIGGQALADQYPDTMEVVLNSKVTVSGLDFAYKEDSLEALAKAINLDPESLVKTVERYNELCEEGKDEDFNKESQYMIKIEAPYYAIRLPEIVTDGYTGARIDENSQVMSKDGQPIQGFYACGSVAPGQMTGINYFGCGTSLLMCGVYGRAAARHAVGK
ncbi:FAD-dependent oxidoreductase [Aerococcus mictus]|uniref:FAD-dependent oxidoreductase n=1 Tax=Aerococcus mictus TaxID=2976810 RepID=UPI000DCB0FB8|nr:FAD-dependent oxidoreductase [Aerococcus mictus]KAA9233730.1 FAD-dependent oxidoreductase [Aerococcus mictus]MDL5183841.1 FAD-dependent oxidoreductase [Aerococcus mictus]